MNVTVRSTYSFCSLGGGVYPTLLRVAAAFHNTYVSDRTCGTNDVGPGNPDFHGAKPLIYWVREAPWMHVWREDRGLPGRRDYNQTSRFKVLVTMQSVPR